MLAVPLTVQGQAWRLAALAPIESELETEALTAWRQLVQVLTHEIMNSLTPIASLAASAPALLEGGEHEELAFGPGHAGAPRGASANLCRALPQRQPAAGALLADLRLEPMLQGVQRLITPAWHAVGGEVEVRGAGQPRAAHRCRAAGAGADQPRAKRPASLRRPARATPAAGGTADARRAPLHQRRRQRPRHRPGLEAQIFTPFSRPAPAAAAWAWPWCASWCMASAARCGRCAGRKGACFFADL